MGGKKLVFNEPILEKIVERFKKSVNNEIMRQEALISYDIDEYDERFLRHLALGYTKEQITQLRGMPFGVKSLEKRQNELVKKLFPEDNSRRWHQRHTSRGESPATAYPRSRQLAPG